MAASAVSACSGRWSTRCSATPACTLISDMWCATTSCSSRAMRSRSSLACRRSVSARAAPRVDGPLPPHPRDLGDHQNHQRPGADPGRLTPRPGMMEKPKWTAAQCRHRQPGGDPTAVHDGDDHRGDHADQHGPIGVAAHQVDRCDRGDPAQRCDGVAADEPQRRRPGNRDHDCNHVGGPPIRLPLPGPERAGGLHERQRGPDPGRPRRPVPSPLAGQTGHGPTVGERRTAVIARVAYPRLRPWAQRSLDCHDKGFLNKSQPVIDFGHRGDRFVRGRADQHHVVTGFDAEAHGKGQADVGQGAQPCLHRRGVQLDLDVRR